MEELVQEQRIRAVAIGAQRLHELGQPEMQALEVLRAAFRRLDMDVMTSRAADVADLRPHAPDPRPCGGFR